MTAADLTKLFAVMQPGDIARIAAAMADWQVVLDRHGDAGSFAMAVLALSMHMATPAAEEVAA